MPREGIDDVSRFFGLRWESPERSRFTIRPDLINAGGLLSGVATYAIVDYTMGSALWQERNRGERIATIAISINYVQTAREGDIVCTATVDRRNDRVAVLRAEATHEDGRLIATAVGSFASFPKQRLERFEREHPGPGT